MMKPLICLIMLFLLGNSGLIAQTIQILHKDKDTSLRGLSVVDNSIAWVSGSKGWTALSKDGGLTWQWKQIKGYENLDFRDIEGFSVSHYCKCWYACCDFINGRFWSELEGSVSQ